MDTANLQSHRIERVRREPKRRRLTVLRAYSCTPKMRRIELGSPDLADFSSAAPDDHVKLFVPDAGSPGGVAMRDYTPRAFDAERATLTIDFDHYLLIGDETALPAIGRRVENLRPGVPVTTIVVVDDPADIRTFVTRAGWRPVWVTRSGRAAGDAALLRAALDAWRAPRGDGYVWIAAEAQAARGLKLHLLEERGHPKALLKATGYWEKVRKRPLAPRPPGV